MLLIVDFGVHCCLPVVRAENVPFLVRQRNASYAEDGSRGPNRFILTFLDQSHSSWAVLHLLWMIPLFRASVPSLIYP